MGPLIHKASEFCCLAEVWQKIRLYCYLASICFFASCGSVNRACFFYLRERERERGPIKCIHLPWTYLEIIVILIQKSCHFVLVYHCLLATIYSKPFYNILKCSLMTPNILEAFGKVNYRKIEREGWIYPQTHMPGSLLLQHVSLHVSHPAQPICPQNGLQTCHL